MHAHSECFISAACFILVLTNSQIFPIVVQYILSLLHHGYLYSQRKSYIMYHGWSTLGNLCDIPLVYMCTCIINMHTTVTVIINMHTTVRHSVLATVEQ